jgi:CPA2 family monovalent cation:H+ antiporter-2
MHESPFLSQIVILFGTAVVVSWLFRVARAPAILGFLFTGILIGPSTLNLIDQESVDQFAEFGLVLLLFTVGLELSPAPLLRMGRRVVVATALQMAGVAIVAGVLTIVVLRVTVPVAALIGLAVSLSSTAISLKQLSDRGEITTMMGTVTTGLLLLQDVAVIAVMVLLPLARGENASGLVPSPLLAGLAAVTLAVVAVGGRRVMPRVIDQVLSRGGHELATLFAVMMAGGGAWLATQAGWSPALGACIAGLLLAGADVRHQLLAEITPFRDVFNALFFISMGMLVSVDLALSNGLVILAAVVATIALKTVITAAAVRISGWPMRIALPVGIGMCTVSEFAYVLLHQAESIGLVEGELVQQVIAYIVGTMMLGAFMFPLGIAAAAQRTGSSDAAQRIADAAVQGEHADLGSHVIVVGYGVNGQNLARVLKSTHIPFCIVEMNHGLAREAQSAGATVIVGDAARSIILKHAGVERARAMVVGINDPLATRRIISIARAAAPALHIVVRTPNVAELDELTRRGANVVVPADFEASVKIFSHVLEELGVPRNILGAQIAAVRAGGYGVFRGMSSTSQESLEDLLKVLNLAATQTFFLPDDSPAVGKSLAELDLRRRTGVNVIAIVRDRNPTTTFDADFRLASNDVLVLVGAHAQLIEARKLLDASTQLFTSRPSQTEPHAQA